MAFTKKTWKDRIAQYLNRRRIVDTGTGTAQVVTVTRDEGSVTEAGDAFSAATMNDLEDRIEDAFGDITASDISYDNTDSGLTADDLQEAVDEVVGKLGSLKIIKTGKGTYSNLKGGGWADRVTTTITFDTPMPNNAYVAFAMVNDGYADYPFIKIFPFSRTTTGFTATCINQSGSQTAVSGTFDWVVIG